MQITVCTGYILAAILVGNRYVAVASNIPQECTKPPDSGVCFLLFLVWHYDTTTNECREFIYRGCGGNDNRFATEEECYKKCTEKLITLEPPQNVTVGVRMADKTYIFWYPPETYTLHIPTFTNASDESSEYNYTIPGAVGSKHAPAIVPLQPKQPGPSTTQAPSSESGSKPNTNSSANTTSQSKNGTAASGSVTNSTAGNSTAGDSTAASTNGTKSDKTAPVPTDSSPSGETNKTSSVVTPVEIINGSTVNISDYVGKTKVPFHLAKLTHFVVKIIDSNDLLTQKIEVNGSVLSVEIDNLKAGSRYTVVVSAVYLTNSTISADPVRWVTLQNPDDSTCFCNSMGTVGGRQKCDPLGQPFCKCKEQHSGLFCELCAYGYYRTSPGLPCHRCPCDKKSSTGACNFVEGYLRCMTCKEEYAGNLCHRCANGYYFRHDPSATRLSHASPTCAKCEGCHNIQPGLVCDQYTGHCTNCHYNTTGNFCDRCLDGFEGDPMNNIKCEPKAKASKYELAPAGVIAAIVIAIIVLLSGIVGFIVYKRRYNFPAHKPFWTIEFKEDHEDVNFSAVPEDEYERQQEDLRFYEEQERTRTKNLPPYSQLQEDC